MVDYLKEYAESVYTDQEMETLSEKYTYARPFTKESLLYREIFGKILSGAGGNDRRILDAEQRVGGV